MRRALQLLAIGLAFAYPRESAAAPCADATCHEWMPIGNRGGRVQVYRSAPLERPDPAIRQALVVVHGGNAGAAGHFAIGIDAARRAGVLETTLVVAPRIPSHDDYVCLDALDAREINWGCQANNGWPAGGTARGEDALTSYDLADALLRRLARREQFPNLARIVVVGHSAGGQYVARYAMANQVHETLGVPVAYVVANPAHYAYPDEGRLDGGGAVVPGARHRAGCKIYDDWPYGLNDRVGYTVRLTEAQLRRQLASRPVSYLLGESDTLTTGGLDTTCAANAQGAHRLERGQRFAEYVNRAYDARHAVIVVPVCGHDARCMLTAAAARPALFPAAPPRE